MVSSATRLNSARSISLRSSTRRIRSLCPQRIWSDCIISARDARLTNFAHNCAVENRTKAEDEIKKAEQHEALKQMFLRLLDDPQVQQKIVTLVSRRVGQIRGG